MDKTICYNLCDQVEKYEAFIQEKEGARIYLGSYFCFPYVKNLSLQQLEEIFHHCQRTNHKITFVLPLISEKYFLDMQKRLSDITHLGRECIDELCVNDYGTLDYVVKKYQMPVHLGRLFFKDYRDPRYEDYWNGTCRPKLFNPYFKQIVEEYQVKGLEFDPIVSCIDLQQAFSGLTYSIHTPYCYITTGQICEYGSIGQPMDQKFRPNESCRMECSRLTSLYELPEGQMWYRMGRAIYFKNETCLVKGIPQIRELVFPIQLEEGLNQERIGL